MRPVLLHIFIRQDFGQDVPDMHQAEVPEHSVSYSFEQLP